ncbi:MAG: hypothetical protein HZB40_19100 [Rhodocyclales bacterium]|nr:hypothetical protein [Rhodocyclales bacterium]
MPSPILPIPEESETSAIVQPERATQQRIIALFRDELHYRFLGDWSDHTGNGNIEQGLLADHMRAGFVAPRGR